MTATSFLLLPMAGMAIGLVATTSNLVPEMGARVSGFVFAMIAIFETLGPFAAMHAFRMSGEAGQASDEAGEKT